MNNIDAFNLVAAEILGELYVSFPRPIHFDSEQCLKALLAGGRMGIDFGSISPSGESVVTHTIDFLASEGLLRYKSRAGGMVFAVVLTARGFQALGRPATVIEAKEPLGKALSGIIKTATPQILASIVSAVMAAAI